MDYPSELCSANPKHPKMKKITIAKGDGIGPEIMDATLKIILTAGAELEIEEVEVEEVVVDEVEVHKAEADAAESESDEV